MENSLLFVFQLKIECEKRTIEGNWLCRVV